MTSFNLGAGALSSDSKFQNQMFNALSSTRDGGMAELRVASAVIGSGSQLSSLEQRSVLSLTRALARDGDLSARDAATLTGMIESFASDGIGSLESAWPFPDINLGRTPGNPLFNALAGYVSDAIGQSLQDLSFLQAADSLLDSAGGNGMWIGALSGAIANADLSKLSAGERTQLLSSLAMAASDGRIGFAEATAIMRQLERFTGGSGPDVPSPSIFNPAPQEWTASNNGQGQAQIDLGNYTIDINEHNSEFILTNKETGERSRIWGDPHFDMDGNGSTDVDFWGTMTMNLEDGTTITINTTPYDANPSMTLTGQLVITKGDQAMVVNGVDQNQIGDLSITQSDNGRLLDALYGNGLNIYENADGKGWLVQDGLFMRELTQADTDTTKGMPGTQPTALATSLASFVGLASSSYLTGLLLGSLIAPVDRR